MFIKTLAIGVVAAAASLSAAYADTAPQSCQATSFRVYFQPGAASLTEEANELIAAATREVSGCADVNVTLTPARSSGREAERSMAIVEALRENGVDAELPMGALVRYGAAGPDYIEVRMAPASATTSS